MTASSIDSILIRLFFLILQVAALDQYNVEGHEGGFMTAIHRDLIIYNLRHLERTYPVLKRPEITVWIENNLTQDLCRALEIEIKLAYSQTGRIINVVKTQSTEGTVLPGITTRHKKSLVQHTLSALVRCVYFVDQFSTMKDIVKERYAVLKNPGESVAELVAQLDNPLRSDSKGIADVVLPDLSHLVPTQESIRVTRKELVTQMGAFTHHVARERYSGKTCSTRDDLVMAVILAIGWQFASLNVIVDGRLPLTVKES